MATLSARCCLRNSSKMNNGLGITFSSSTYAEHEAAAHGREVAEAKGSRTEDTLPRRAKLSRSYRLPRSRTRLRLSDRVHEA